MNVDESLKKLDLITFGYKGSEFGYTCISNVLSVLSIHEFNYMLNKNILSYANNKNDNKNIIKLNKI